ncbi:MAG: hypothetical protein OXE42_07040 [Gammaproteobacteria bacterium]|nr:hypothetical protein [Gammaproteobacteria bacterium]
MFTRLKTMSNVLIALVVSVLVAAPGVTQAQQAEGAAVLEEIIVTAQKREESIQDVGLTISAFTGDRYRELSRGTLV